MTKSKNKSIGINHPARKMALQLYNAKFILLTSASFITIFSSIAIYFCLPILLSHLIREQITLSPNSGSISGWKLNQVVDRIYLYNITNLPELIEASRHSDRQYQNRYMTIPKLSQIGPFTFEQIREKVNIQFETKNETVTYDQRKTWHFLPEHSITKDLEGLKTINIAHISVPLVGAVLKDPKVYSELLNEIVTDQNLKLFINHTADELLFNGYFDVLMEQGKSQEEVDVDRFGWMYNQNNSLTSGYRIFTGKSEITLSKFGTMNMYKNRDSLDTWVNLNESRRNVRCNEFQDSSAGDFFPPSPRSIISYNTYRQQQYRDKEDLKVSEQHEAPQITGQAIDEDEDKSEKVISIFLPDICRTIEFHYNKTIDYKGLLVDRYIANEFTFDYTDEPRARRSKKYSKYETTLKVPINNENPNSCFCRMQEADKSFKCPPNGMMELYSCKKGNPLMVSFPHFLYSRSDPTLSPYLSLFEDPVLPDESEHQSFIDLETSLNLPIRAQIGIQMNVRLKNEPAYNFTVPYSFLFDHPNSAAILPSFYLPQMWIQSRAEVDEHNLRSLKFLQSYLKLVTPFVTLVMFTLASILLAMSAKMAYDLTYGAKQRKGSNAQWKGHESSRPQECDGMLASFEMSELAASK